MRIRIDLSYDGTEFSGWAKQPGLRTIQGEVEAALNRILRMSAPARMTVAGRTDAGVHARAQVAHVDLSQEAWEMTPGRSDVSPSVALERRLNAVLPPDIAITATAPVSNNFNARFSALWRRYSYCVTSWRDPLRRRFELHHEPIDIDLLNEASTLLVGERDFTPFCKARPGATAVRTLQKFDWVQRDDHRVVARLQADAFCHNMVRSLVGACLAVGSKKRDLPWLEDVAKSGARSSHVQVAPAHALILEAVGYPPNEELVARAQQTRRVRTL